MQAATQEWSDAWVLSVQSATSMLCPGWGVPCTAPPHAHLGRRPPGKRSVCHSHPIAGAGGAVRHISLGSFLHRCLLHACSRLLPWLLRSFHWTPRCAHLGGRPGFSMGHWCTIQPQSQEPEVGRPHISSFRPFVPYGGLSELCPGCGVAPTSQPHARLETFRSASLRSWQGCRPSTAVAPRCCLSCCRLPLSQPRRGLLDGLPSRMPTCIRPGFAGPVTGCSLLVPALCAFLESLMSICNLQSAICSAMRAYC